MRTAGAGRFLERCMPALAVTTLLAVFVPLFFTDYGVHNDYRIGGWAGDRSLAFGHVESFHLVRAGRILNAWLYNRHWNQIDAYTDLRWSRLLSALVLAASMLAVASIAARWTALSRAHAALLALALFLTPALTVDAYYAQQLVPGSLAIAATIALFAVQRPLLLRALDRQGAWSALWLNATLAGLVAGHFVYTPSTAIFLVLAAIALLHATDPALGRRAARAEIAIYAASYVVYFLAQTLLVFPWASRTFAFSALWFDPQYNVALDAAISKLALLRQATSLSLNAWNAFERVDLAWFTAALLLAAIARAATAAPARRHGAFVATYFAACFGLSLAPFVVSTLSSTSYRMLVGPLLLVATAVIWSLCTLLRIDPRAPLPGRVAAVLSVVWLALASNAGATLAAGIRTARAEIECLTELVRRTPDDRSIALVDEPIGGNGLHAEFGVSAFNGGPLGNFAIEVVRDLARRGDLDPARGRRVIAALREVSPEEARSLDPSRFALLRPAQCAIEAGLPR